MNHWAVIIKMKFAIIVKPLAVENIQKAYSWYENELIGLGEEFLDEWESLANHISIYAESYPKKYKSFPPRRGCGRGTSARRGCGTARSTPPPRR